MTKILTISGSPVEGSSTEILLRRIEKALIDNIGDKAEVIADFVRLNDLKYIPCQSCGEAPETGFCLYDDNLADVYRQLESCDCLLFGSPIYFDTVSAQAKMFIDRCNCVRPPDWDNSDPDHDFIKLIKRKRPGAMVLVGGERGYFEGARRVIAGFFKWVEVVNEGHLMCKTDDFRRKGTAADDPEILKQADDMGRKLAELVLKNV